MRPITAATTSRLGLGLSFNAKMSMMEYINKRKAEGATLSLAVRELAGIP